MEKETETKEPAQDPKEISKRPDDSSTVHVDEFVRIHDPNTKQVYHEGRA